MARTRLLHRVGAWLSLSWSLRNRVVGARHLGRATALPMENFLIKKGRRRHAMQRVWPRGQGFDADFIKPLTSASIPNHIKALKSLALTAVIRRRTDSQSSEVYTRERSADHSLSPHYC
ncbi:hypothetical protein PIB30_079110 [Stylosanthes scabra]|uniref:Secreted protein n=1 Tax=Stylosanthes scabra TaxID=79078 RepID=A0ABU6XSU5_9FABA|nr:hypothetical protein [Stylosanthes scabra]